MKKWTDDVSIKVHSYPTEEDMNTLNDVIRELNDLISTINLSIVDDNENISMCIMPKDEFEKYVPS